MLGGTDFPLFYVRKSYPDFFIMAKQCWYVWRRLINSLAPLPHQITAMVQMKITYIFPSSCIEFEWSVLICHCVLSAMYKCAVLHHTPSFTSGNWATFCCGQIAGKAARGMFCHHIPRPQIRKPIKISWNIIIRVEDFCTQSLALWIVTLTRR